MLYLPAVKVGTIHEKIATRLAQSLADFASVWRGEQLLLDDARLGLKNGGRGGAAAEKAPDRYAGGHKKASDRYPFQLLPALPTVLLADVSRDRISDSG